MTGFSNPELLDIGHHQGARSNPPAKVILGRGEVTRSRPPKHSDYVQGESVFRTGWAHGSAGQQVSLDFSSSDSPVKAERIYVRTTSNTFRIDRCESGPKSQTNGYAVVTDLEASKRAGKIVSAEVPLKGVAVTVGEDIAPLTVDGVAFEGRVKVVVTEDTTLATSKDLDWLDHVMIANIDLAREFDSALEGLELPSGRSAAD